ncbi:MAG: phage holin family protein [Trueperaceae bacterium]
MNNMSGAEERSLGSLIAGLLQDIRLLFSQEIDLAKREVAQKISVVSKSAVSIAIGVVLALGGVFVLIAAFVLILDLFMPAWAAALVLALVFLAVGGLILFSGIQKLRTMTYVPERTVRTVEEGVQRVRERVT